MCDNFAYYDRVGLTVTVYEVKHIYWRAPAKGWYVDGARIQYGGMTDGETWEREWAG